MDTKTHWEEVYSTKAPEQVSWFSPHLQTSLSLIQQITPQTSRSIIDVGGGESTLADDLLSCGYRDITVLDVAQNAIDNAMQRLGSDANRVTWLVGDVISIILPERRYDVWHDRAAFHFLTRPADRQAYVHQVASAVKVGGHVIVATFGPKGPRKCSGMDVMRYDARSLHGEFGRRFRLVKSSKEIHQTPFGTAQEFLYCYCVLE